MYNRYGVPRKRRQLYQRASSPIFRGWNGRTDRGVLTDTTRNSTPASWIVRRNECYRLSNISKKITIHATNGSASYHGISQKENGHRTTEPFHILDEMMENSIWMEMNELGYSCTVKTIQNLIYLRLQHHLPSYSRVFRLAAWMGRNGL